MNLYVKISWADGSGPDSEDRYPAGYESVEDLQKQLMQRRARRHPVKIPNAGHAVYLAGIFIGASIGISIGRRMRWGRVEVMGEENHDMILSGRPAKGHSLNFCEKCEGLFCENCSDADTPNMYCSIKCEEENVDE